MEYVIFLYSDETMNPDIAPGTPEFEAMMGEWMAFNQTLIDAGQFIGGASLAGTDTATTLEKKPDGTDSVTDGPYAETKEQIGGYYIVSCETLDDAIDIARRIPIPVGKFEVRPIGFRPTAD